MLIFFPVFLMEFEIKMDFDLLHRHHQLQYGNSVCASTVGRAEEVQQQHNNNNNNKCLLPKSNMRSVHCFICFGDDGSVQQDVIVFAIFEGVCFFERRQKLDVSLMLVWPFPVLLDKMSFIPTRLRKARQKLSCCRKEIQDRRKWTWT